MASCAAQPPTSEYKSTRARLKHLQEEEAKQPKTYIIRMRGLPFQANEEDIKAFFAPVEIAPNGIFMPRVSSTPNMLLDQWPSCVLACSFVR